jgi:cell division protein ZapA (FtsZ GTPase activity inhibitor)
MIDLDVINLNYNYKFSEKNVEWINNKPEEIKAATIEFDKRLHGLWNESEDYKKLRLQFINTLKSWKEYNRYHGKISGHLSETFLMNNHEWLLTK